MNKASRKPPKMTSDRLTPHPRSYWVMPGRLLAGAFPAAKDSIASAARLQALFDVGIRCTVNLMEPAERDDDGDLFVDYAPLFARIAAECGQPVACMRFPVPDLGVPEAPAMKRILDAMDASIADGKPVYVHCRGGIGRTGTVVGCFLIHSGEAEPETVIERIHDLRRTDAERHRPSPETKAQVEFVRSWPRP